MAFVRRIGNAFYLVHNVRRGSKVKQLHLARLGDTPRITDDVVRQVSRKHPLLGLNWSSLRERVNSRVELFDVESDHVKKLVRSIFALNLDLAGFSPPVLKLGTSPEVSHEIITQLRLLRSTVEVKLNQFEQRPRAGLFSSRRFR